MLNIFCKAINGMLAKHAGTGHVCDIRQWRGEVASHFLLHRFSVKGTAVSTVYIRYALLEIHLQHLLKFNAIVYV